VGKGPRPPLFSTIGCLLFLGAPLKMGGSGRDGRAYPTRSGSIDHVEGAMPSVLLKLDKLFAAAKGIEAFEAGDTVFSEGDPGNFMFVVVEGTIDIFVNEKLIDISGPGDLLGEMALIDSKPRSATAIARTAARLARVDEGDFLAMVGDTPFFALHVMRVLVERMRRASSRR
jgi:CRP/FNR family transcriptional regulator, cyclic AMP receptor protein